MTGIKQRVAKGAAWLVMLRLVERAIGVVSTIVLARLLVPADFGVVAMAMSVYAALEVMTSFSFDLALIQNREARREHYDTAWTFNVLFGTAVMLGMLVLAWPTSWFYNDPRVAPVIVALGLAALLRGFENVGVIEFQRDLKLLPEFQIGLIRKLVGFMVTLAAALTWGSYWALVAGILAQRVASLGLTYAFHAFRPRLSLAAGREMIHFSKWLAINNITVFAANRLNDFIVGRMAGPAALGAYNVSYELASLPTTELVHPIGRALFPGLSSVSDDLPAFRRLFLQVLGVIAWFTFPISVGMIVLAEPLVLTLLGEKWRSAIVLVQVLSVFGVIRSLSANAGSVYLTRGRPQMATYMTLLALAVMLPLSIWGTMRWGATGAAVAALLAASVQLVVLAVSMRNTLDIAMSAFLRMLWRPLAGSLLMGLLLYGWDTSLQTHGMGPIVRLLTGTVTGTLAYLACIGSLWKLARLPQDSTESVLLDFAGRAWRTRRQGAAP